MFDTHLGHLRALLTKTDQALACTYKLTYATLKIFRDRCTHLASSTKALKNNKLTSANKRCEIPRLLWAILSRVRAGCLTSLFMTEDITSVTKRKRNGLRDRLARVLEKAWQNLNLHYSFTQNTILISHNSLPLMSNSANPQLYGSTGLCGHML